MCAVNLAADLKAGAYSIVIRCANLYDEAVKGLQMGEISNLDF
jgi:hypothetical protein